MIPVLLKEFPGYLTNKMQFRIYTVHTGEDDVRYYFAFPKKMLEQILDLLETDMYWGEHSFEDDQFYLYYSGIYSKIGLVVPWDKLDMRLKKWFLTQYNACLRKVRGWMGSAEMIQRYQMPEDYTYVMKKEGPRRF